MKMAYGSVQSVDKFNKANGIVKPVEAPAKKNNSVKPSEGAFVIADETVTEVTEDELALLDNIILKNDPNLVYMRSDIEAYDSLYFTDNSDIANELLKEVRGLRRVYRNYRQYLYACYLRDKYLDSLEQQFHTDDDTIMRFKDTRRVVNLPPGTFIPPVPIYSRHAEDWDKVKNGTFSVSNIIMQADEDAALEAFDRFRSSIDVSDMQFVTGVMTDRRIMNSELADNELENSRFSNATKSVNVADLDAVQKYMRYWFKKEKEEDDSIRSKVPFPKSEEGMRKLTEMALGMEVLENYYSKKDDSTDDNEMVFDEVLQKPMSRKEYNRRMSLRTVCDAGGWDIVKVMSQLKIGSKYERRLAKSKSKRNHKIKKQVDSFMSSLEGDDSMSIEELQKYLFGEDRR